MENRKVYTSDPVEKTAMNLAEGLMNEIEKVGKTKKKGRDMSQSHPLFRGFQLYSGIIFCLAGALLAEGRGAWLVILFTVCLFLLEILDLNFVPEKKKFSAQVVFSGTILMVGILQVAETIGRNFSLNVFYLLMTLVGGLLIFTEIVKSGSARPVNR